jgi:cation diffusion facilitator CzcD-associated flavoprotein CzcO
MATAKADVDYDVVIIGAGISGINFAYRLQERHPDLSYCILEARHEIGGTWSLFNYPGMHA